MGLFKTILIIAAILIVLNFIKKYINPIVKAANNVNEKAKQEKNTVTYVNVKKEPKGLSNTDEEYIEYKEIK